MALSYGQRVNNAISKLRKEFKQLPEERDYEVALRFSDLLQAELGLKVLVLTDVRSTDKFPRLNITVWTKKRRIIKNPDIGPHFRESNLYFYYP